MVKSEVLVCSPKSMKSESEVLKSWFEVIMHFDPKNSGPKSIVRNIEVGSK